jgi:hypothetical protein
MKLKYYLKELEKLAKDFPEAEMIYAAPDGSFRKVIYTPTVGEFKSGDIYEDSEFRTGELVNKLNSICVN